MILDTNALSAFFDGHPAVTDKLAGPTASTCP